MPQIWLRYAQYMPEICVRYAWDMHKICLKFGWDLPEIRLKFAIDFPKKCLKYAWDMLEIGLRYAWYLPEICLRYSQDMTERCTWLLLGWNKQRTWWEANRDWLTDWVTDWLSDETVTRDAYASKKYRKAEYVQRRVPSSNVQVLIVFGVVLIVVFYRRLSSIKECLPWKVVFH